MTPQASLLPQKISLVVNISQLIHQFYICKSSYIFNMVPRMLFIQF